MKTKSVLGFMILLVAALAQDGSTPRAESSDASDRQAAIRSYLEALDRQPRMDRMPGAGPTIEQKLLRVLAEEVLSLRQENAALKQALEQSKKKG